MLSDAKSQVLWARKNYKNNVVKLCVNIVSRDTRGWNVDILLQYNVPFAGKIANARDCVCIWVCDFFYINLLT